MHGGADRVQDNKQGQGYLPAKWKTERIALGISLVWRPSVQVILRAYKSGVKAVGEGRLEDLWGEIEMVVVVVVGCQEGVIMRGWGFCPVEPKTKNGGGGGRVPGVGDRAGAGVLPCQTGNQVCHTWYRSSVKAIVVDHFEDLWGEVEMVVVVVGFQEWEITWGQGYQSGVKAVVVGHFEDLWGEVEMVVVVVGCQEWEITWGWGVCLVELKTDVKAVIVGHFEDLWGKVEVVVVVMGCQEREIGRERAIN
ncbi:hypothetical protein PILCRDRAFT_85716 [Piloderma croceum F 1598]|uniref:Uncharacterized protein n=1 Tax=Piloderma croceum (strain F 1598) TaxID=765440 RepID=A0A0C3GBB0_PILCF|nr:hypothetical protein PILCRDRAFT_85716 [Piloderma croceum F 1598]